MPVRARDVTKAPPRPGPPSIGEQAEKFYAEIDTLLAPPWEDNELEDSDNGGDHDRKTAGRRFDLPEGTRSIVTEHIVKVYEQQGWRVRWHSGIKMLFAPKHLIVQR